MAFVAWRAAVRVLRSSRSSSSAARRAGVRSSTRSPAAAATGSGSLVVAVAGLGVNVATFVAFDLTTVALVLLAFYTYPALVAVVAVALGHERLDGTRVVALGLALGGMVLVVAGGLDRRAGRRRQSGRRPARARRRGASRRSSSPSAAGGSRRVPPDQAMGWVLVADRRCACARRWRSCSASALDVAAPATAAALGLAAARRHRRRPASRRSLFLVGIRAIGGTRAGILMLIEPLVGVTLAALLLHEALLPIQVVGGGAILAAALLLQRGRRPASGREPRGVPVAERT